MATLTTEITKRIEDLYEEIKSIREHLHTYPELSFQEKNTSLYIQRKLDSWNIPYTSGWAGNGIVAVIEGTTEGDTIGLRADMDALPIQEENDVPYRSQNDGCMHACGHDVHTSCLLGAIRVLSQMKDRLKGRVVCVFQPGEEQLPGGASIMIKEGLLEKYPITEMYAIHVHPPLEAGHIGIRPGMYMASADEIYLHVRGKGGHGALPHKCIDTVLVASKIVVALQEVAARRSNPITPSVLSFGKMFSHGGATNVLPDAVTLEGTFRTLDEVWRAEAHDIITRIAENTAIASGAVCEVDIRKGYPYLENNVALAQQAMTTLEGVLGSKYVHELPIRMTAEDFAFFSQKTRAVLVRVGVSNKKMGISSPVHTPTFDIDPQALKIGIAVFTALVLDR